MIKSQRERDITRVSVIGIVSNALLGVLKVVIGVITHSISIITDAVNNLTDTGSSIITIIGTHLAGRQPDAKHPFGYGRIEYLTSLVIGLVVFFTGVEMCRSSIDDIIHPHHVDFNYLAAAILAITVVVKIFLGIYTLKHGKKDDSTALVASGLDARSDAVATGAVLLAVLLYLWFDINIDAWMGAIISLYIVKTGYDILKDTVSKLVGEPASTDLANQIRSIIKEEPMIKGAFDIVLNNYGPDYYTGSINVEVPYDLTAEQICNLLHPLQERIEKELRTFIVFGIYAVNKKAPATLQTAGVLDKFCQANSACLSYHGLFVDEEAHKIFCDIVVDFGHDHQSTKDALAAALTAAMPGYTPEITVDSPSI